LSHERRRKPDVRRDELLSAANRVFGSKGVSNTAVSDIVKEAGVAQGTFYLYFKSKEDLINAVADNIVGSMVKMVEDAVLHPDKNGFEKLMAFRDTIVDMAVEANGQAVSEIYHRPENSEVHHQMVERIQPKLAFLIETIVQQGIDEGHFNVQDARLSAWFILGGIQILEAGFSHHDDLVSALDNGMELALKTLGCKLSYSKRI
jgi:AcrR family transcriptional regulator